MTGNLNHQARFREANQRDLIDPLTKRTRVLYITVILLALTAIGLPILSLADTQGPPAQLQAKNEKLRNFDAQISANANALLEDGRQVFRFNTFGDEAFWGGALQLHQAIKGVDLGGVGPGLSPTTSLSLGLKVDVDALPQPLIASLERGAVNLDDPATT